MRIRRSAGLAGRLALLVALLALSSPAPPARAQQGRADVSKAAAAVAESQGDRDRERKYLEAYDQISTQATVRCVAILVFGLVLVTTAIWMRRSRLVSQMITFKIIGLTLVVTAGLLLVVAGFSNEQITSMMGLLGTVAGYILGKGEERSGRLSVERAAGGPAGGPRREGAG